MRDLEPTEVTRIFNSPSEQDIARFYLDHTLFLSSLATANQVINDNYRDLTKENQTQAVQLREDRRKYLESMLEEFRQKNNTKSVVQLLRELQIEKGMMWVDVARLVRVSVPALRKWRLGTGDPTPENHKKLSTLKSFLDTLNAIPVSEPVSDSAAWMVLPMLTGYSVTPSDLYSGNQQSILPLLDYAARNINAEEVLDEIDPGWKSKYSTDFELFLASDGYLSLRPREVE